VRRRDAATPGRETGGRQDGESITQCTQSPDYGQGLSDRHKAKLTASGISAEVAAQRGYVTVVTKKRLLDLGFGSAAARVPTLLIPVHNVIGEIAFYQHRPDNPD
jgi:hypothetical protein